MYKHYLIIVFLLLFACSLNYGQSAKTLFTNYMMPDIPGIKYGEIIVTRSGPVLISASEFSFALVTGGNTGAFTFGLDNQEYGIKNLESIFTGAPIKAITESKEGNIFFATAKNQITFFQFTDLESGICDIPPFYFPVKGDPPQEVTELSFDSENNLLIGVRDGAFFIVPKAGDQSSLDPKKYKIGRASDSTMVILKGELPVKKIMIGPGAGVYSFADNKTNKNSIWIGTSDGLFSYNKDTGELSKILLTDGKLTITHIESFANGDAWLATREKGMVVYNQLTRTHKVFPYPKKSGALNELYPIEDFCIKSPTEFLVAINDSVPAIFNTIDGTYKFINDSSFVLSENSTTDIRMDTSGNFYFIKGGLLYSANIADNAEWAGTDDDDIIYTPIIYGVTDFNKREITNFLTNPHLLEKLKLKHHENSIIIFLTSNYLSKAKPTRFAWTLDGDINSWVEMPVYTAEYDSSNTVELPGLKPGKYLFRVKVKVGDGSWSKEAVLPIIVGAPFWTTWWFWTSIIAFITILFFIIIKLRVRTVRKEEKMKARYEKELMELEAKALRAQMNPHFVFNCLNSIKALMQEKENEKGIAYLTTFSKMIRTLFNNADRKEISLYDEIETCKLYLQLESMRFDSKFSYSVNVDGNLDLKSIAVPALIIQPFIENAIWHGIVPQDLGGHVSLNVSRNNGTVEVVIDDDGIGREVSRQNKSTNAMTHQSKGVNLTRSRLELDNLLQQRQAGLTIIDKKDQDGKAGGTKVVITIKEDI